MKYRNIVKSVFFAVLALSSAGCVQKEFNEITEMQLKQCLEPQNLAARVNNATGDDVTFSWDVNKDAQYYNFVAYTDEAMTTVALENATLAASDVPYTVKLPADQEYFFKVQAVAEGKESSKWAVYDGSVKTFAVKDNLFPVIVARTERSITLKWEGADFASDFDQVTHITARPVAGGSKVEYNLTDAEKQACSATVSGLAASTEYQVTLFYLSASRGALDAWTRAEQGSAVTVSSSAELLAIIATGGEAYLTLAGSPYEISNAKPKAGLKLIGELAADGSKPEVIGKFELTEGLADGSEFYAEGIKFNGGAAQSRIVEHTGAALNLTGVTFKNCEITNYLAGLFYDNNDNVLKLGALTFETCDIYNIVGSGGDAVDIRKACEIDKIVMKNNTIYDGMRTFFRIDAVETIKIGEVDFQNNTVKGIAVINDGNNQGLFAFKSATTLTLKNNLFLYEDGGETDEATVDKCQLIRDNNAIVVPTINASGNYSFAQGKDFFKKVSAAEAGFTILTEDPCYNSKGGFFQLSNANLIDAKVGASKWWISYTQKAEDLTQNVLAGAHTWNLQDAKLFAGDVTGSRVREELMLVASEAVPMNADGGINFLSAAPLNRKGVPTDGYVSFIVDTPGSVDLEVADNENRGASVVVGIADDNGFRVLGGAVASEQNGGVVKVVAKEVAGQGTVYIYPTGPISIVKLAWSKDVLAGSKVLPTPAVKVEPVTLTEGDETAVTITWDAIPNAAAYKVIFNKKAFEEQTECSFTVEAADIAALKAGLYSFSVQAFPAEGDIYYQKSEQGTASFAIQPKGGAGEMVTVEKVWDFSQADWQAEFAKVGASGTDITNWSLSYDNLSINSKSKSKYGSSYFQFGGKSGDMDRYFKFTAPEQGTLKITVSNTGDKEDLARTVDVTVGSDTQSQPGGVPASSPAVLEYNIMAGEVVITAPVNGLRFYKIEYTYTTGGAAAPIEFDWDFSGADWQAEFAKVGASGTDITNWSLSYDNLSINSKSKSKYGSSYFQFGGKSGDMDRYFKFTAPEQGTLKITVSNTGDKEDLARTVDVTVGSDTQSQPGGVPASSPAVLEYNIMAGEVVITAPVNGLRFYRIYYTNQ